MRQYKNFSKKLKEYNINVITNLNEFIEHKNNNKHAQLTMKCFKNHVFTMKIPSISNKFSIKPLEFCHQCTVPEISGEEKSVRDKCTELGFTFISFKERNVEYKCVCGNITTTGSTNILRINRKPQCPKCQNIPFRNKNVIKIFQDNDCILLSEYTNRHEPVEYKCSCGNKSTIRYSDFSKGKRCLQCKPEKYKQTCQINHNVDNMFQLESIKEKSKKTCIEKYGVEHCMQSPEIHKKAMSSSFHRKKIIVYNNFQWIVQGYEPQCIKDLLNEYEPTEILAGENSKIPTCKYIFNGKNKVWYPDVYLPCINMLIEVKSTFTYNKSPKQTREKILQAPFNTELRIYNKNGSLFEKITKDLETGKLCYVYGNKFILGESF